MSNRVVLVTGAAGFIGQRLSTLLRRLDWTVIGTVRSEHQNTQCFDDYEIYHIGGDIASERLKTLDAVVHLAHDFDDPTGQNNIKGTVKLSEQALRAGVQQQVFISSYSSKADAVTNYGQTKFAIESKLDPSVSIIRPGLVVGESGLFGRIHSFVKSFTLVPQIGVDSKQMPIVDVDDLCEAIAITLERSTPIKHNLYQPQMISYSKLVASLSKHIDKWRLVIPVPVSLLLFSIKILQMIGLTLPISKDNVQAFVHNQAIERDNQWPEYPFKEKSLAELLSKHFPVNKSNQR